ncbi:MAG: type II toxin-antitoxin system RelE/ParE family toxin [Alphaproteobacteria bacterium]
MTAKPVVPRARARRDIEDALDHYLTVAGEPVALRFVDAVERAFAHIGRHPQTGSDRFAHELDLPGLRFWPVRRFPHLVFFVDRPQHVDVWRVLHGERDLPSWLRSDDRSG